MDRGKPIDPGWIEWAEQETIKHLRARLERADEGDVPAEFDRLRIVRDRDIVEIDLRPVREIQLSDGPEEALAVPGPAPVMIAARSDGLVVRIHRENL